VPLPKGVDVGVGVAVLVGVGVFVGIGVSVGIIVNVDVMVGVGVSVAFENMEPDEHPDNNIDKTIKNTAVFFINPPSSEKLFLFDEY